MRVAPEQLYEENHEALCRYLSRYTGDAELAADLVQETFLRLLERPPPPGYARPWLFRVASNLARDATRRRRRYRDILAGAAARLPQGDPPPEPDQLMEQSARAARAQQALLTLSDRERTALLMREEGFRHHEIAAALGCRPGTVGALILRALRKLSRTLDITGEDL